MKIADVYIPLAEQLALEAIGQFFTLTPAEQTSARDAKTMLNAALHLLPADEAPVQEDIIHDYCDEKCLPRLLRRFLREERECKAADIGERLIGSHAGELLYDELFKIVEKNTCPADSKAAWQLIKSDPVLKKRIEQSLTIAHGLADNKEERSYGKRIPRKYKESWETLETVLPKMKNGVYQRTQTAEKIGGGKTILKGGTVQIVSGALLYMENMRGREEEVLVTPKIHEQLKELKAALGVLLLRDKRHNLMIDCPQADPNQTTLTTEEKRQLRALRNLISHEMKLRQ